MLHIIFRPSVLLRKSIVVSLLCIAGMPVWAQSAPMDLNEIRSKLKAPILLENMALSEQESLTFLQNSFYVFGLAYAGSALVIDNPDKSGPLTIGAALAGVGYLWSSWPSPATVQYSRYLAAGTGADPVPFIREIQKSYASQRYVAAALYALLAAVDRTSVSQDEDYVYLYPHDYDRMSKVAFLSMAAYMLLVETPTERMCQRAISGRSPQESDAVSILVRPHREGLALVVNAGF